MKTHSKIPHLTWHVFPHFTRHMLFTDSVNFNSELNIMLKRCASRSVKESQELLQNTVHCFD